MSLGTTVKNICRSIGEDNNPAYAVVAIATAKGIFRPLFTMMDKKESPETKKYAALREGLTEVIAIPTYLLCGTLAGKGAALFKDPVKAKMAKHNLRFVGVCTAALLVIPGLCSVFVKPFTDKIFHKNNKNENVKSQPDELNIVSKAEQTEFQKMPITQTGHHHSYPAKNVSMTAFTNSGMRV